MITLLLKTINIKTIIKYSFTIYRVEENQHIISRDLYISFFNIYMCI